MWEGEWLVLFGALFGGGVWWWFVLRGGGGDEQRLKHAGRDRKERTPNLTQTEQPILERQQICLKLKRLRLKAKLSQPSQI